MPTGYTHDVQTGKVTEFSQFAMQCARAFGALIMMRDDPNDAPIPDEFKPSTTYYDDSISSAIATLNELQAMTPEQIGARLREEHDKAVAAWQERKRERETQKARYSAMLEKVNAWEPPSPDHQELKKFMAEQLTSSIDFDCKGDYDKYPEILSIENWLAAKIREARRSIEYSENEKRKEIERTADRNKWVRLLRESLQIKGVEVKEA